jgi:DNA-binding XRE family transcriptional regulator
MKSHPEKHREQRRTRTLALLDALTTGQLTIGQATREMRKITGQTQAKYAKFLGIYPRVLLEIEHDRGNPTLETLQKIGKAYGLQIGFVPKICADHKNQI